MQAYFHEDADTMYTHDDMAPSQITEVAVAALGSPLAAPVSSHSSSCKRVRSVISVLEVSLVYSYTLGGIKWWVHFVRKE